MHAVFLVLASLVAILSIVCSVLILIEAFRDEIWKGFVCLLCGFYFLYYAIFDYDAENKWLIVIGSLGGGSIAAGLARLH